MSAIPYMPLWVSDYLADTQDFSTEEHGAYMLLIMTYWQRGEPLPNDPERLARVARLSNERWTAVEPTLKRMFSVCLSNWTHHRIEAELTRARDKIEKAREAGKKGGRSKKAISEEADAKRTLSGRQSGCLTTQNPDSLELESNLLPTEQEPEIVGEQTVRNLLKGVGVGTERHTDVTADAKRLVCQDLDISDAEPLVRVFDRWSENKPAKTSRDAWFRSVAPKLWKNNPAVHAACKPLNEHPPPEPAKPAKAGPALIANVSKGQRNAH